MLYESSSQILKNNLISYLKISRMSQNFFANKINVDNSTISRWLKGERQFPLKILDIVSSATGIPSYDWINPQLKFESEIRGKISPDE